MVIFDEFTGEPYPYLDRILEVPSSKNGHLVKTIRPQCSTSVGEIVGMTRSTSKKRAARPQALIGAKTQPALMSLPEEKPAMLIAHLIPEKALTFMAAPSYTGKTHIAIEMGLAMATGTDFLDHFKGPAQPVPVIYHVPELHASLFRTFMERLGAKNDYKEEIISSSGR